MEQNWEYYNSQPLNVYLIQFYELKCVNLQQPNKSELQRQLIKKN